jgi:phospholipase C
MRLHKYLAGATLIGFTTAALVQTGLSSCSLHKSDSSSPPPGVPPFSINQVNHVVVIYQENWSFDGLFGQYPGANGLRFNTPLSVAGTAPDGTPIYPQVDFSGTVVATMPPPTNAGYVPFTSSLYTGTSMPAQFFNLADFDGNNGTPPTTGNVPWADANTITNDITHRFVHEQLQIDGGRLDQHIFWSDTSGGATAPGPNPPAGAAMAGDFPAGGNMNALSVSGVDGFAQNLPTTQLALQYVLCDNCFQSAFGGSFLNHQFLIAAQAPVWPAAQTIPYTPTTGGLAGIFNPTAPYPPNPAMMDIPLIPTSATTTNSDGSLSPTAAGLPVVFAANPGPGAASAGNVVTTSNDGNWDLQLTNGGLYSPANVGGNYFCVNTMQPPFPPTSGSTPANYNGSNNVVAKFVPPQTHPTIGSLLDGANVPWKWYAEGWNAMDVAYTPGSLTATPNPPSINFQYHHQPFNYFAAFDPSTHLAYRNAHLQDLDNIYSDLSAGTLPNVSFVKFAGDDNEHPGYASLLRSETAVYNLVKAIQASPNWADTVIIITYDEFGGRFDHVPPPVIDHFGPGHRIPMVIVSPFAKFRYIDHTQYETVSILSFIEHRWKLAPLTARDAAANYFLLPFMNTLNGNG